MKKSIVFKWFILTVLLFSTMVLIIGVTQNYFFEKYYINKKLTSLQMYMNEYLDIIEEDGVEATLEEFYKNNNIWITKLDEYGQIYDVGNYYIEVELKNEPKNILKIPMYSFEGEYFSNIISLLEVDDEVIIDAINIKDELIPYQLQINGMGLINLNIAHKIHGANADKAYNHLNIGLHRGRIISIVYPEQREYISFPYNEAYFIEQIKEFQVSLLANNGSPLQHIEELSVTENFTEYKVIIKPVIENGETRYIFAMTTLQPVDEAISVMNQFYPYFLGFTFLCIIFLAFFFPSG